MGADEWGNVLEKTKPTTAGALFLVQMVHQLRAFALCIMFLLEVAQSMDDYVKVCVSIAVSRLLLPSASKTRVRSRALSGQFD